MKHSSYLCRCALLFILLFELFHSAVEATLGVAALPEEDDPGFTVDDKALTEVTPTPLALSKPASSVSLPNDHVHNTSEVIPKGPSHLDNDQHRTRHHNHHPETIKVVKAAVTAQRKLKKDGGKSSKRGQTTPDIQNTKFGFFGDSTVGRQSIPTPSSIPRSNPLPSPVNSNSNNDNVFDRRRSPEYTYTRPSFRPPILPGGTAKPSPPSPAGTRPTVPTRQVPTRPPRPTPIINTPVPTSEMTESFFPTDSATLGVTMEYTTLPPSFSPAPTK